MGNFGVGVHFGGVVAVAVCALCVWGEDSREQEILGSVLISEVANCW